MGRGEFGTLQSPRQRPTAMPSAPSIGEAPRPSAPPAPAVAAQGVPIAGGVLYTGVTAATFYDDNVFASHGSRFSDVVFVLRPEFAWATQGANYTIGSDGFVESRKNVKFDSEDQFNGGAGVNFTVAPDSDTQVVGNGRYIRAHLERGSSDTIGPGGVLLSTTFNAPVEYDQGIAAVALNKRNGRWWGSLGVAGVMVDYANAKTGPFTIDFGYNDGGIGVANGRVGYVIMPQTSLFVEAAGNIRNWRVDAFDSTGYRLVGGLLFEQGPGARLRGEAWAGYMGQQYNGISFQTVSSWTYGATLGFAFTDQLGGVIEGKREAKEAALSLAAIAPGVAGASSETCAIPGGATCVSVIGSSVGGRLEYRILPNLIVGGGASFTVDEYLGERAGNRVDRTLSPMASIKFLPYERLILGFDYRRVMFDPSGGQVTGVSAVSYFRDVYLVSMNGKF
ncbi:MAG TPA: outer membrane beta-barrel protein [Rhodopseudomonas sp.]